MDERRMIRTVVVVVVLGWLSTAALADTIYLKNGRVIQAARTEVIGDKLVFQVFGAKIAIPMARVERIEKNDRTGATVETTVPPTPPAVGEDSGSDAETGSGDADESDESEAGDDEEEEVPPEETREYWQGRVKAIDEERAALQEAIVTLRREERAFLFSRRSTADTRQKIEAAQTRLGELDTEFQALRREARRKGVPPGWLRVR